MVVQKLSGRVILGFPRPLSGVSLRIITVAHVQGFIRGGGGGGGGRPGISPPPKKLLFPPKNFHNQISILLQNVLCICYLL